MQRDAYYHKFVQINGHQYRSVLNCFLEAVIIEGSLEEWLDILWVDIREENSKYRENYLQRYEYMSQHGILKKPLLEFGCIWVKGREFREKKSFEYRVQELGAH